MNAAAPVRPWSLFAGAGPAPGADGTWLGLDPGQWLEFAARLHPLVLHLPIGLAGAVVLLEGWAALSPAARGPRRALWCVMALSALAAAASGWLLGRDPDYAGALVDEHRTLGLAAAAAATLGAGLDLLGRGRPAAVARGLALSATLALIALAGHHGGQLTHGPRFLAAVAPPVLAPWLGPGAGDAVDGIEGAGSQGTGSQGAGFQGTGSEAPEALRVPPADPDATLVLAALRERCIECHGPDKAKSGLRLDRADGVLSTLVPGEPGGSLLLERVRLPRGHEHAMPPSGAALDGAAIAALERWIAAGAPLADVEAGLAAAAEARAAEAALLDGLRARTGARIEREPSGAGLTVAWSHAGSAPGPDALAALAPVAGRVVELDLAGVAFERAARAHDDAVDDAARPRAGDPTAGGPHTTGRAERAGAAGPLAALPPLPALDSARLERGDLGDTAVRTLLARAPRLRSLNLHSTPVTPALVDALRDAAALRRVVLFDTALGPAELDALRRARPDLELVAGDDGLPADPLAARPVRRVLAADAGRGRVALLREVALGHPEVLWERAIEALHDLQWIAPTVGEHGRVLIQDSWTRVLEVDTATDSVLWSYDATATGEGPVEIHSFRRLDDGTTLVAESGRARLVLVDADGAVVHTIPLTVDTPDPHRDTRLVRPTPTGTFLVAHERDGVVREYDREGRVVWEYDVPLFDRPPAPGHGPEAHGDQVFCALRLADGDTLVSTGNGSSLLRVRPNGSLRWHLGASDLFGVRLGWTTAVQELSNGNLVLGNCHAGPDQPQAIELSPAGEPVWTFADHVRFGNDLSNLVVVEAAP